MKQQQPSDLLPHDKDAELAVLGAIILRNDSLKRLNLLPEDFFSPINGELYRLAKVLHEQDQPIDELTLYGELQSSGKMAKRVSVEYLLELAQTCPVADNIEHYARRVKEKAIERKLFRLLGESQKAILDHEPILTVASKLNDDLRNLNEFTNSTGIVPICETLTEVYNELEEKSKNPKKVFGIPTGFIDLDEKLQGLENGQFVVICARPSMGKTALLLNIMDYISQTFCPTLIASLETPSKKLGSRLVVSNARVNYSRFKSGTLEADEWDRLLGSTDSLSQSQMFTMDNVRLTLEELEHKARKFKLHNEQFVLGIDYLQLLSMSDSRYRGNRTAEVSEISRRLKQLAIELQVPLIALSQLNRDLERRVNKRPIMADLRESGGIEQDADTVISVYRDEYYDLNSEDQGIAEIAVLKGRDSGIGVVRLGFTGEYQRFSNLSIREQYA